MSINSKLFLTLLCCVFASSCANRQCDPCINLSAERKTAAEGATQAKIDIRDSGYQIYRYDMPPVRTGAWSEYYSYFEHFGIKELGGGAWSLQSLEFMEGYNQTMDSALLKKYGKEYSKYRSQLMPHENAKLWNFPTNKKS